MSRQGPRFRGIQDDTTNPTLFKIVQSQTFLQDETVLSSLDEFIDSHPSNNISINSSISYSGVNPTVLSQLNRLQRSLRGLPPLFESETSSNSSNTTESSNKKIVFEE